MQTNRGMPLRHTWSESDRFVPRAMVGILAGSLLTSTVGYLLLRPSGGPRPEAAAPPGELPEPRPEPVLTAS